MNPLQEMVLMSELVLQVKIAKRAAERLYTTESDPDAIDVWGSIQSILIAAANVSKILWPSKKYQSRGERLRNLLNIEEGNILSDRKFRNHFEHYDERIEEWFENQPSAIYTDLAMNPSLYTLTGMPPQHHRGYNSFNKTLDFRGESLDLGEVVEALEDILRNCKGYVLT